MLFLIKQVSIINAAKNQLLNLSRNKNAHTIIQRMDTKKPKQLWYNSEFKCLRQKQQKNKKNRVRNFFLKQK